MFRSKGCNFHYFPDFLLFTENCGHFVIEILSELLCSDISDDLCVSGDFWHLKQ